MPPKIHLVQNGRKSLWQPAKAVLNLNSILYVTSNLQDSWVKPGLFSCKVPHFKLLLSEDLVRFWQRIILTKSNWAHAWKLTGTAHLRLDPHQVRYFSWYWNHLLWWLNVPFTGSNCPVQIHNVSHKLAISYPAPRYVFVNLKRPFINLTIFQGCQIKQPLPIPVYQLWLNQGCKFRLFRW